MSIYCKLIGDSMMANHKFVAIEDVLDTDDWGLIINKNGDLKGLYVPKGQEDDEVPEAIMTLCEKYFGVDWEEEDVFMDRQNTLHLRRNMEVIVRNNNVEKALRVMKRKLKKDGLLLELKERAYYQKPSEKKRLAKKRGIKRALKAQRDRNRNS